jgi:galactonate dehydratase
MTWHEMDMWDAQALADIRQKSPVPIGSLESVVGRRSFRPFLERGGVDFAIVDLLWNGWSEALKIAAMGDRSDAFLVPVRECRVSLHAAMMSAQVAQTRRLSWLPRRSLV